MLRDGLLTKFQATHLLRGRYKNFYLGKFKLLEPLGTGGMSQVFLAEHVVMKHRVAIKMLPVREGTDPAAVSRFLREARAAAAVNHPNVVRAHDFDIADGKYYYLVKDYVDGVNLHDLDKAVGPHPPPHAANCSWTGPGW
jgi:serine/threonine protein kinase